MGNTLVQPYLHEADVGAKFAQVQEMMDVLYQCEDVRDHLNELAEMKTRASGFMGTGFNPAPQIENMDEHAKLCGEAYKYCWRSTPPSSQRSSKHLDTALRSFDLSISFASQLIIATSTEVGLRWILV